MGPSAQKHTIDDFNADNFDHSGLGFIRGAQISIGTPNLEGGPISVLDIGRPRALRAGARRIATSSPSTTRATRAMVAQTENLPIAIRRSISIRNVRDTWGLPAPRMTYDWRRPNEMARVEFVQEKMEEIGRRWAPHVWPTAR